MWCDPSHFPATTSEISLSRRSCRLAAVSSPRRYPEANERSIAFQLWGVVRGPFLFHAMWGGGTQCTAGNFTLPVRQIRTGPDGQCFSLSSSFGRIGLEKGRARAGYRDPAMPLSLPVHRKWLLGMFTRTQVLNGPPHIPHVCW